MFCLFNPSSQLLVPFVLHHMLIQWVGDNVEIVHVDASACIAMANAPVLCAYDSVKCLAGVEFSDYQFINVCEEGFTHVMLEPVEKQLNPK